MKGHKLKPEDSRTIHPQESPDFFSETDPFFLCCNITVRLNAAVCRRIAASIGILISWIMSSCGSLYHAVFAGSTIASVNIQGTLSASPSFLYLIPIPGIIVLRIWYLYSGHRFGRIAIISCFAASIVIDVVLVTLDWSSMGFLYEPSYGCVPQHATHAWQLSVHHLVLHSLLYIAATVPAVLSWRRDKRSPLAAHILREYVAHTIDIRSSNDHTFLIRIAVVAYSTSQY